MVAVNNACRALFIFIAFTLMGCQSNVELPAQLVAVVDNYPPNYIPDSSHMEYSRKINVVFKIKNVSWRNLFIPISDERGNEYHSFILLSAKHSVLHPNSLTHCSLDDFMLVTSPLFVFCYPWR